MGSLSIAARLDRTRLAGLSDALVVAVAVALPWSTTATGVLLVLWLVAFIPTLEWPDVRRELMTAAGGLPVLLFALGVLGMAWADVSWNARWDGLDSFWKLLIIPLLMTQFRRSANGHRVFVGFLAACVLLLIASYLVHIWPSIPKGSIDSGVIVKSYIVQSMEFVICVAGLVYLAVDLLRARRRLASIICLVLACAFLLDIFLVATSRTALIVLPVLFVVYGFRQFGGKGVLGAVALAIVVATAAWMASPYLRERVSGAFTEVEHTEDQNAITPAGERIVFWTKSLGFIESSSVIGHGTGSITEMFRRSAVGQTGVWGRVSSNPHNQTFAVGIQLGLLGIAVLWAMWLAHLAVFRPPGFVAWIGLVIVIQNVVGSLFNSFLFDFTEGWLYVVGFGVAAGMMRRETDAAQVMPPNGLR